MQGLTNECPSDPSKEAGSLTETQRREEAVGQPRGEVGREGKRRNQQRSSGMPGR